jgi:hypothetical protein
LSQIVSSNEKGGHITKCAAACKIPPVFKAMRQEGEIYCSVGVKKFHEPGQMQIKIGVI